MTSNQTPPAQTGERDNDLRALQTDPRSGMRVNHVASDLYHGLEVAKMQRDEAIRLVVQARDERDELDAQKWLRVDEDADLYRRMQEQARRAERAERERDGLRELLRSARAYIPRGPRVDESDLLADIARALGEIL